MTKSYDGDLGRPGPTDIVREYDSDPAPDALDTYVVLRAGTTVAEAIRLVTEAAGVGLDDVAVIAAALATEERNR